MTCVIEYHDTYRLRDCCGMHLDPEAAELNLAILTADIGVVFDGAFGQVFNDARLVHMAIEHGMHASDDDVLITLEALGDGPEDDDCERLHYLADYALTYMNETVLPEPYALEWVDGDLYLDIIEDDDEVDE